MSINCCFKLCKNGPLNSVSARAEIKSAIPSSGLSKHKGSLLVSWKKNGEAIFHPKCWTALLSLSRKGSSGNRKRKSSVAIQPHNDELVMVQTEKVMIKEASKTVEKFDSEDDIKNCAMKVVEMIQKSKHCVFFTGAGISTSAGMGDFRGKGGKWTEEERGAIDIDGLFDDSEELESQASPEKVLRSGDGSSLTIDHKPIGSEGSTSEDPEEKEEEETDVNYEDLRPTLTHEAISKLIQLGHVKYLISQNCDGLHLLSGVPARSISELHGNVFVEKCEKCTKRYQRPYYVCEDVSDMYLEELADFGKTDIIAPKFMKKCEKCELCHRTGRRCDDKHCKGFLMDTIINFGDNLEDDILDKAYGAADSCDLMVCLGTTLKVTPANELVDCIRNPQRIVICNRQPTDKDKTCLAKDKKGDPLGVRVYGDCDVFMRYLMSNLLSKKQFDAFEKKLAIKAEGYNDVRKTTS